MSTNGHATGNGHPPDPDPSLPPVKKPRYKSRPKGSWAVKLRAVAFLEAFINGPVGVRGNVTKAMRAAGYRSTDGAVRKNLLSAPLVQDRLRKYLDGVDLNSDKALQILNAIVFSDITDVMSWDSRGNIKIKSTRELDTLARLGIAEFTKTPGQNGPILKVKMHDKGPALKLLFQYLKLIEPPTINVRVLIQQFIQKSNIGMLSAEEAEMLEALLAKIAPATKANALEGMVVDGTPEEPT